MAIISEKHKSSAILIRSFSECSDESFFSESGHKSRELVKNTHNHIFYYPLLSSLYIPFLLLFCFQLCFCKIYLLNYVSSRTTVNYLLHHGCTVNAPPLQLRKSHHHCNFVHRTTTATPFKALLL
ncbi:hypothetical protein Bca4012_032151 [Brassica carinata]